jgi:hypothetical protein
LYGSYRLTRKAEIISVTIRPDHTYSESIERERGPSEMNSDHWIWDRHCVMLEGFLIPNGSVPEDLFQDIQNRRGLARKTKFGTYQFDWCLPTERSLFGSTRLVINPDRDDFDLVKVAP